MKTKNVLPTKDKKIKSERGYRKMRLRTVSSVEGQITVITSGNGSETAGLPIEGIARAKFLKRSQVFTLKRNVRLRDPRRKKKVALVAE